MHPPVRVWLPGLVLTVAVLAIAVATRAEVTAPATVTSVSSQQLEAFERAVEAKRKELGVAGAALVIVKDDNVIYQKAHGRRDFYFNRSATIDTLFPIASASKPFTAMALLMSEAENRLTLKDSPRKYLPYFKLRDPETDANITLRELLTHSSGLPRSDWTWFHGMLTREELIRILANVRSTAKLGQRWEYNNNMYTTAGEVLGRAYDTTWEQAITERLFKPLRMNATVAAPPASHNMPDFALGYAGVNFNIAGRWPVAVPPIDSSNIGAAGAIASSARDMAQWLRFLLGRGQFEGKRLISEAAFAEAFRKHMTFDTLVQGRQVRGYGLGWFLGTRSGYDFVEHGGNLPGFTSLIYLIPEQNLGFALLTNQHESTLPAAVIDLVWTHLADKPRPQAASKGKKPATRKNSLPAPDETAGREIMAKAVQAAGGERLRQYGRMTIHADVNLESQGLTGKRVLTWTDPGRVWRWINWAPGMVKAMTTYTAFGKTVFNEQASFDGGTWSRNDGSGRRPVPDAFLETYELLDWRSTYTSVALVGRASVNGEQAYRILKVTKAGKRIFDYISTASFLVLKRDSSSASGPYSQFFYDYKDFEGVMVAMRTTSDDPSLGRTVMRVTDVKLRD